MAEKVGKKIVIIGDGDCGKTSLMVVYCGGKFPTDYIPTVFEVTNKEVEYQGQEIELKLWDTAGQEDYGRLRILAYEDVDVVIMAFSLVSRHSFSNIIERWIPEYKQHLNGTPIVLVGTKKDLISDAEKIKNIKMDTGLDPVTTDDIKKLAKKISASAFIECSAFTGDAVQDVFQAVIKASMEEKKEANPLDCCVLS
eukprot:GFUD01014544.1.p1 GENE.GFUD01014544.1~~GFUD01014544.1.p1  ORF type:complete len:197 (+),score=55.42 GFUD01014544.1:48-638(+)